MKIAFALFLSLVLAFQAKADTLAIAADPWPPFIDENHPEGGVSIQIIREALGRHGFDVELNIMPWARAIDGVRSGDFDILPGTWYTESRSEDLMYSEPYVANEIKFIKRAGEAFDYSGLDSLDGEVVAIIRDYGYGDAFYEATNFERDPAPELMTNIRKLVNERVDLAIEDEFVARFIISNEEPELLDQIEFVEPPYSAESLHLTSGYANPRHEEIVEAFNAGLAEMREDGTFDRIMEENDLQ